VILCGSPGKGNAVHGIWVFAELAAFRMIFGGWFSYTELLIASGSNLVLSVFEHFFLAQDLPEFAGLGARCCLLLFFRGKLIELGSSCLAQVPRFGFGLVA